VADEYKDPDRGSMSLPQTKRWNCRNRTMPPACESRLHQNWSLFRALLRREGRI